MATMNKVSWIPSLAVAVFTSATLCAQATGEHPTGNQGTPVTVLMDWSRGDSHYGGDFIQLHRRCEASTVYACECVAAFKVISSKKNSKEFANYVASFEHGKVPVVYSVFFNDDGQAQVARLVSVGDWTSDRFHQNDGILGVRFSFPGKGKIGQPQSAPVRGISECFPLKQR
jgi:hypothetical protein